MLVLTWIASKQTHDGSRELREGGEGTYQHLLCCSHSLVLLLDINQGAVLTVEGLLQGDVIPLLAAFATLEPKLPDGEGGNVQ